MTKSKHTKRALIVSALCLLLCVSMLVGTTFAWFTDNASTSVNKIEAGTLKIDIVDEGGKSLKGETLKFADMDDNDLWEPGVTYTLADVHLVNKGNLALKYKVTVNGIVGKDAALADVIDVVIGGKTVGTLSKLLADPAGISYGAILPTGATLPAGADKTDAVGKTAPLGISLHMQESAGNAYQGMKLEGISVTVQATQYTFEYDSNNNAYDENAQYAGYWKAIADPNAVPAEVEGVISIGTAQELANFAASVNQGKDSYSGKTVKLTDDIDLENKIWEPIGQTGATQFGGVFDGNGHTIFNLYVDASAETSEFYSSGLFGWIERHGDAQLAVKNLKIDGAYVTGHHYVAVVAGYLIGTVENCQVKNASILCTHANDGACGDKAGIITGQTGAEHASVKNCSATNCAVAAGRDAGQLIGANTVSATVAGCTATNVVVSPTSGCTHENAGKNIENELVGRK